MRKLIASFFISLDGVVEAPDKWHFPYFNDEMGKAVSAQIATADTMLLGRRDLAGVRRRTGPTRGARVELADHMNTTPKLVVSTTLQTGSSGRTRP